MIRSLIESLNYNFEVHYESLKKDLNSKENFQQRIWFLENFQGSKKKQVHDIWIKFIQDYKANISFFDWFKEYATSKSIYYPFGSSIRVTTKSTQTLAIVKGEKKNHL